MPGGLHWGQIATHQRLPSAAHGLPGTKDRQDPPRRPSSARIPRDGLPTLILPSTRHYRLNAWMADVLLRQAPCQSDKPGKRRRRCRPRARGYALQRQSLRCQPSFTKLVIRPELVVLMSFGDKMLRPVSPGRGILTEPGARGRIRCQQTSPRGSEAYAHSQADRGAPPAERC
jgi:hypothetical protein